MLPLFAQTPQAAARRSRSRRGTSTILSWCCSEPPSPTASFLCNIFEEKEVVRRKKSTTSHTEIHGQHSLSVLKRLQPSLYSYLPNHICPTLIIISVHLRLSTLHQLLFFSPFFFLRHSHRASLIATMHFTQSFFYVSNHPFIQIPFLCREEGRKVLYSPSLQYFPSPLDATCLAKG